MIREREAGGHTEDELRARFDSIDENKNDRIDLDEFIRFSLRDALARSSARVIDPRPWGSHFATCSTAALAAAAGRAADVPAVAASTAAAAAATESPPVAAGGGAMRATAPV